MNLGINAGLSAGLASLVLQFSALITIVLGAVLFREPLHNSQIAGIAIALAGLLPVAMISDGTFSLIGLLLVMLGAAAWSAANILVKKSACREMFAFVVWSSLFAPLPLFLLSGWTHGAAGYAALIRDSDWTAWFSVAFQVYPTTLFGYWAWNSLMAEYPVSTVAPLSLLVPVFGMLGSVWLFGEPLGAMKLAAMFLIISGLAVGLYGRRLAGYFRR